MKETLGQIGSYEKKEIKEAEKLVTNAYIRAINFSKKFGIKDMFNYDPEGKQLELFTTCFVRYDLLKRSYERNQILNHPSISVVARTPILGRMVGYLDRVNSSTELAVEIVSKVAEEIRGEMLGIEESMQSKYLLPSRIEAAANFMTTALFEHRKKRGRPADLAREIEEIKGRYGGMQVKSSS